MIKILIVDDVEKYRAGYKKMYTDILGDDVDVRTETTAEEAIRALKIYKPHITHIDIDLNKSGSTGNGLNVLQEAYRRKNDLEAPVNGVIIITAMDNDPELHKAVPDPTERKKLIGNRVPDADQFFPQKNEVLNKEGEDESFEESIVRLKQKLSRERLLDLAEAPPSFISSSSIACPRYSLSYDIRGTAFRTIEDALRDENGGVLSLNRGEAQKLRDFFKPGAGEDAYAFGKTFCKITHDQLVIDLKHYRAYIFSDLNMVSETVLRSKTKKSYRIPQSIYVFIKALYEKQLTLNGAPVKPSELLEQLKIEFTSALSESKALKGKKKSPKISDKVEALREWVSVQAEDFDEKGINRKFNELWNIFCSDINYFADQKSKLERSVERATKAYEKALSLGKKDKADQEKEKEEAAKEKVLEFNKKHKKYGSLSIAKGNGAPEFLKECVGFTENGLIFLKRDDLEKNVL